MIRYRTMLLAGSILTLATASAAWAQNDAQSGSNLPPAPPPASAPPAGAGVSPGNSGVSPTDQNDANAVGTPGTSANEVVVTGLRRSLQSAESIKRNSDDIVDSIVAEDIGKFPDNAVSDALQRVTGVQVFRGSPGETNTVVVRGLPNVITTLNGREIFTGSGRGFSFQDLPAESVARVDVYKTSSAELLEGGIAGIVNIDLHKPFDFDGFTVAGTLRGVHEEIAEHTDPIAGLLISNRWHTSVGEIGALVDVSYLGQHYDQPSAFDDVRNPVTVSGQTYLAPNTEGALYNIGRRERPQINVALQWRPNENLELYADALYTSFRDHHALDFWFSAPGSATSASNVSLFPASQPGACQAVGTQQECELQSGIFNNPYTASSTQAIAQHSYDSQYSTGAKWHKGSFKLSTDLSYTASLFTENIFIIDTPLLGQTLNANTNVNGRVFWNLGANSAQLNPNAYTFNGLFQTWDRNHGDEVAYRIDGEYDLNRGIFENFTTGFRYAHRIAYASGGTQISTPPPAAGNVPGGTATPAAVFGAGYFQSSPDELGIAGVSPFLTGNTQYLFDNENGLRNYYGLPAGLPPADPLREFNASEDTYAGYVQTHYRFNAGPFPVDGLVGVRLVGTQRSIDATGINNGLFFPVSADTSDFDALPNASARIRFTQQFQTRLSYAKTASRPDFGQLNPSVSLEPPTVNRLGFGSGGNPDLKEIKSDNYDVSFEYYFARTGQLSLGLFYRDIDGYIQTYSTNETIGGINYIVSSPQSAGSGHLDGLEATYQQFYDFLPGSLSGLGLQLNYTYIEGQTEAPNTAGGASVTTPLGNVSKNNGNAVLIYEKYGFSGRLSYNYRGSFISAFNVGGTQQPQTQAFKPERHLDLSLAYDLGKHWTVTADATNLTRNDLHEYLGTTLLPQDIRLEERTFSLGLRFKY